MESRDRDLLLGFVDQLHGDLPLIFEIAAPFLHPAVADRLGPAWDALEARGEFAELRDRIANREYDERLDRAGLSGPELEFKLAGVEAARTAGRERRSQRLLKRWLGWLDVILGSLLSALGVGEGIKELKEGVEAELEP